MTADPLGPVADGMYRDILRQFDSGFCIVQVLVDDDRLPIDYRFIEVNDVFARETGLHNVVGRTAKDAVPGLEDFWVESYGRIALTGEAERFGGGSVPMGDRYFDVHAFPVGNPDDLLVAIIFNDVTHRRHLEQQQEDFLAMASHDLRSPATIIAGRAQLMRRRQAYDERGITAILDATHRIDRLAEDLQGLVHLERGVTLSLQAVDMVALADRVVEQFRHDGTASTLAVRSGAPCIAANVDVARLQQVLTNLVGNAIKYSPDGGEITVDVEDHDDAVTIMVTDEGLGIPPESIDHLFVRFYRAANATGAHGLGLGLYITQMLVAAHGGTISVTSEVGAGSQFVVRLPKAPFVPLASGQLFDR